jgi:hypothetical protein
MASTVEKQHDEQPAAAEPAPATQLVMTKTRAKQGGSGATTTPAQQEAARTNIAKAAAGKMLKKDLEKKVEEMTAELEATKLEAQRQREKKQRHKARANTLAELAANQNREPRPPAPTTPLAPNRSERASREAKSVAFEDVERPEAPNPRDNPHVRRLMSQGADLRTAMAMVGM